jgi:hypothetical protein
VPVQSIDYRPSTSPGSAAVRSARAWPGYRRCMALFDQVQRELIAHVVLLNWSVRRSCE